MKNPSAIKKKPTQKNKILPMMIYNKLSILELKNKNTTNVGGE